MALFGFWAHPRPRKGSHAESLTSRRFGGRGPRQAECLALVASSAYALQAARGSRLAAREAIREFCPGATRSKPETRNPKPKPG